MKPLRSGYSTGTCSAAAAKAAVLLLCGQQPADSVGITLPDGAAVQLDLCEQRRDSDSAFAVIVKDAGDDPDVTSGAHVTARAEWREDDGIELVAGEGIGTVTLPGLQVPPGQPAINPVPRAMIEAAVREVTGRGVRITLSVPGGAALARKTFNARLGVVNGISILGTTGRVKPYSCEAVRESLKCALDVAVATGIEYPVLAPGNIGKRAARALLDLQERQVVEAGNEWGYMLDACAAHGVRGVLAVGHPGKLAKLAHGHWDTHSSRSPSAVGFVAGLLPAAADGHRTVDGLFASLPRRDREDLGAKLSADISRAIAGRLAGAVESVAVALVDMQGNLLGRDGSIEKWKWRSS